MSSGRRIVICGGGAIGAAPLPAVLGYKGHSLVFETGETIPAEALFLEYREANGEILTPGVISARRTTWVISTIGPLPVDPADVAADEGAINPFSIRTNIIRYTQ